MTLEHSELRGFPSGCFPVGDRLVQQYVELSDLPTNARKRDICIEHMDEGRFDALTQEWFDRESVLPREDQVAVLRYQHVCPGAGVMRECRLRIEQFDERGNKLGGVANAFGGIRIASVSIRKPRIANPS